MVRQNGSLGLGVRGRGGQTCLGRVALWVLLLAAPIAAYAQAPGIAPAITAQQIPPGDISGTVTDSDGDAIPSAQVTLSDGRTTHSMKADGEGWFSFVDIPAGTYSLTVTYTGFATVTQPVSVKTGEEIETPDIILSVSADVSVDVSPHAQYERAEVEMHVEEAQRLGGLVPNFYVTYDWHAAPLTSGQKFRLAWRSIIDPFNFVIDGGIAGVEQATGSFAGYGQGASGYGKRYGSTFADSTIGGIVGGAVIPSLLKQDPRYFYKGTGSIVSRALYAMATAFVCRGDNGRWQPNYSSVAGDIASGAISQLYYPDSNRSDGLLIFENGLLNAAEDGFGNLLQEFLFRKITPKSKAPNP